MPQMSSDPRDYKIEISSLADDAKPRATVRVEPDRDYLRILFACCNVYQRVRVPTDRATFDARCPKCLRPIRFRLAPGGSADRTFVVE